MMDQKRIYYLDNFKVFLIIIATLLLYIFLANTLYAKTLIYRQTIPGEKPGGPWKIFIEKTDNGYIIKQRTAGDFDVYHTDSSFALIKWIRTNPHKNTEITAERKGTEIYVTGKFKNKEITKKIKIDKRPWIQEWYTGFQAFFKSDDKKIEFWTLDRGSMKRGGTFQLEKKKLEPIIINGKKIETIKTHLSLTNPLFKIFWKGKDMWFGKSQGEGFCVQDGEEYNQLIGVTDTVFKKNN